MGKNDIPWNYSRFMDNIMPGLPEYHPREKSRNTSSIIGYMLDRTQSMFHYSGLPESIPQRMLELYLQTNGNVCIARHDGEVYAFFGGLGGEPDVYYRPTIYTVSNPALHMSKNFKVGDDCVVIPNDSLFMGLLPLFSRYASAIVESELTLYIALINTRLVDLITAGNDRTKLALDKVISDIEDGKLSAAIDKGLETSIHAFPYADQNGRTLIDLIEVIQYQKANWYNEIGLNANYNMKRESLNSGETGLNDDALLPLIDDMLSCRREGLEKVNAMFGLDISVELASAWQDNQIETALKQDKLKAEGDSGQPENLTEAEDEQKEGDENAGTSDA